MPEETKPEATKPKDHEYVVTLPAFEGPLDLLLHLIQKHELDIFDIPVSFVTEKYLEYIMLMETLSIDVASEYLVMAATLAYIKSRSLLPNEPSASDEENLDDDPEMDPREELIRRLLEYQKYKQAAADLNDRGALGRDVFLRGSKVPEEVEGPAPLAPIGIWNLLDAFGKVLARAKVDLEHEISFDRMSITDRINQLLEKMAGKKTVRFEELFDGQRTRFDIIITFLAVLEMTRLKLTRLYQPDPLGEIFIETVMSGAESGPPDGAEKGAEAAPADDAEKGAEAAPADDAEKGAEAAPADDAETGAPAAYADDEGIDESGAEPAHDDEGIDESNAASSPADVTDESSDERSAAEVTERVVAASLPEVPDENGDESLVSDVSGSDTDPPPSDATMSGDASSLSETSGSDTDPPIAEASGSDTDPPLAEVSGSDTDPPPSDESGHEFSPPEATESGAEPPPHEVTEPSV